MKKPLLTPKQVQKYLNVNKFTLYRLITQENIPAYKVGGQWRFKEPEIERWLKGNSNKAKVVRLEERKRA